MRPSPPRLARKLGPWLPGSIGGPHRRAHPRLRRPPRLGRRATQRPPQSVRALVDAARRSLTLDLARPISRPAAMGGALLLLSLAREARSEALGSRARARPQLRAHDREGGAAAGRRYSA